MSKNKNKNGKLATEWNLSQLYKSPEDPKIEVDILSAEKTYGLFAKKYKKLTTYLKDENALAKALLEYEKLADIPTSKSIFYLHLAQDINNADQKVRAKMNLISQRLQKLSNVVVFFEIGLSKVSPQIQAKFLKSKKLLPYKYFLQKLFDAGKHTLSEQEEKILSLKSLTSHSMWTQSVEKIRSKQVVEYKGKEIQISKAGSLLIEMSTQKERLDMHNKIIDKYYALGDIAESEINAIVTDKK